MEKKLKGYVYKPDDIFLKAKKGEKFAALLKLRDILCPDVLYLTMDRFEEKPANLCKMLAELFPLDCVTSGSVTTFSNLTNGGKSDKKPLVVVWDSCLHKESYKKGSCVIVLVEDEEEVHLMKSAQIKEMNVSTLLYFNGGSFEIFPYLNLFVILFNLMC